MKEVVETAFVAAILREFRGNITAARSRGCYFISHSPFTRAETYIPTNQLARLHFSLDLSVELTTDSRNGGTGERNGIRILSRRKLEFVATTFRSKRLQTLFKFDSKAPCGSRFL